MSRPHADQAPCAAQTPTIRVLPRRLLPLAALTGLTALKLQHCAGIRRGADLAPLSLLTALSSLNLSGCSQEDGSGISSFATLTGLRCARIPLKL